jgi:mannosyltransferase
MPASKLKDADSPAGPNDREARIWLIGLTAAALALRLYHLDSGLWIDEISSLLDSFRQPLSVIASSFPGDNRHPLYSLLAWASIQAFGEAPWTIRLPAALFGTASVPMLYLLGREAIGSRQGLLAATFLAVSYHHVWFSQNARGYSALAFFAIAACYLLLRGLRTARTPYFVAYALATGLGAYTHLTMVFLAVGQAAVVAALLSRRSPRWSVSRRHAAIAFVGGAAITVLLYSPMLAQLFSYFGRPTNMVSLSTPAWATLEAIRVLNIGFGWTATGLLAATCVAGGMWSLLKRRPVVFGLFAVPALVTIAGAALFRGTMYPRFFFFLCGFAVLILVEGSFWIGARLARARWVPWTSGRMGTAVSVAIIVASATTVTYNYQFPKQDFFGAAAYIKTHRADSETAAVVGIARRAYREYMGLEWPDLHTEAQLQQLQQRGAVWLVYSYPRYVTSSQPGVWQAAARDCSLTARLRGTVGDGDVYILKCPQVP